jgi:hypothetical protein
MKLEIQNHLNSFNIRCFYWPNGGFSFFMEEYTDSNKDFYVYDLPRRKRVPITGFLIQLQKV